MHTIQITSHTQNWLLFDKQQSVQFSFAGKAKN